MNKLISVQSENDILAQYRNTPISKLLEYHNLNREFDSYQKAELLVGMCMDNRKHLHMPDNFSYIIRTGGANLRYSEFKVSYAIAVGQVRHVALIGHNNCGMVNLVDRKNEFIAGLVESAGWTQKRAEDHFLQYAPIFEIHSETDFVLSEAIRLREVYPSIVFVPMFYKVDDNKLYFVREDEGGM